VSKNDFQIEYQSLNIAPAAANFRLFQALSMLISEDDLYDDENTNNGKAIQN